MTSAQDDPINQKLAAAKQKYQKDIVLARESLLTRLKEKEMEARKAGNLQLLETVRAEGSSFESKDVLPRSVQTRTYTEAIKKARKQLDDAFVAARKAYTQTDQIDEAKEVDKDLQELKAHWQLESIAKPENQDLDMLDLLKLTDPKLDTVRGHWVNDGKSLINPSPVVDNARISIPVWPDGDYELLLKFTRLEGPHGPGISLPVGSRQVNLVIGSHGKFSGLQKLDGRFFYDSTNPTKTPGMRLVANRSYSLMARVTLNGGERATIQIDLDGERVIDWTGVPSQLSMDPVWGLPDNRIFGLHAWETVFRFDAIRLRMLSGEARRPWRRGE